MKRLYYSCICLLLMLFFIFPQFGTSQTSNFIYFGITQDKNGNLWLGTMDGVSKYNGRTFKNYKKDQGMAENWVTASLLDRKGNIWFGHWAGGISYYDYLKDTIITFNNKDINKNINAICEDKSGNIWFGTAGMGIVKFRPDDKNGKSFFNLTVQEGLSGNKGAAICVQNMKCSFFPSV